MPRAPRTLAACAALAAPVAGCGDSSDDPIEVVKQFVEAYDRGDTSVCDDLVTAGYLEQLARATRSDGKTACRQQIEGSEGADIALDVVPSVEEAGDTVDLVARLTIDGRQVEQRIRLARADGELLVDRVSEEAPR